MRATTSSGVCVVLSTTTSAASGQPWSRGVEGGEVVETPLLGIALDLVGDDASAAARIRPHDCDDARAP